jgi:hypothetical protein
MAVSRFASIKPLAATNTLLWEADRQALVSVVAVNLGGTTKISAYVDPSNEPPIDNIYYMNDIPFKNRDTFETFKLAINVGDQIFVRSESGDVSFFTNGIYDKNGTVDVHVGPQTPLFPVVGTIWINESNPAETRVQVFDNGDFIDVGVAGPTGPTGADSTVEGPTGPQGTFDIFDDAPASPDQGDVWFNSSDGRFYVYYDSFWVEALSNEAGPTGPTGPAGGPTGPGVAAGGTEGQVLLKVDGTDYNTTWADNSAESTFYLVRNNTGSAILKGTLVAATGAEPSGRIDVAPFEVTGLQDSELRVMGVATANISNGVNGTVMSFGTLRNIDTRGNVASAIAVGDETWAEGDILFAHPTVDGKLTKVRPQHDLVVAFITVRSATAGQIAIRITSGNHLEWLHDVNITGTVADKEILSYDNASSLWINQTANEAGLAPIASPTFTGTIVGAPAEPDANANTAKNLGYIGLPQVILNTGNLTLSKAHAGEHIYVTGASQTITIPANGTVPFEIGTTIVIINANVTSSIAITTDVLRLAGTASTGSRSLAAYGMATLVKIDATTWIVSGNGLT